jgi:hypothetical protein
MILLNFSHPITDTQLAQIRELSGIPIERLLVIPTQFDHNSPFTAQISQLLDRVSLSETDWQSLPLLVNLPSLAPIAALLIAELHGRCGYFPSILRLRPLPDATPPQFEVAEILNLQAIRDQARLRRAV